METNISLQRQTVVVALWPCGLKQMHACKHFCRYDYAGGAQPASCESPTLSSPSSESGSSLPRSTSSASVLPHESSVPSAFSTPPSQKSRSSLSRSSSGSSSLSRSSSSASLLSQMALLSREASDPSSFLTPPTKKLRSSLSRSSSSSSVLSRESSVASQYDEEESPIFNEDESQMPDLVDSDSDDSEDEDDCPRDAYDAIQKKRGGKISYSVEDRIAVTPTVLAEVDWCYLAPRKSLLYPEGNTKKNGDTRKHAALDFKTFKRLIKPTIRDLAGRCVNGGENVHLRFFWAAYDVVRKRRANHVQNWRLHNQPRDLIYGGKCQYIKLYGDPWTKSSYYKKKRRRRRKRKGVKNLTFDEPVKKERKPAVQQQQQQRKPAVQQQQQQFDPNIIVRPDRALAPFAGNVDIFDQNFDDVFNTGETTEEEDLRVSF